MSIFRDLRRAAVSLMFLLVIFGVSVVESKADVIGICGPDVPGQCTATVNITGNVLTVTLTNTAPPANGGFLTAFAFNLAPGTVVTNFATTEPDFDLYEPGEWDGNVAPDGTRTHLIGINSSYQGVGVPSDGTGTGASVTFTLTLQALNGNTELSVFNSAAIRSGGYQDGSSDKDLLLQQVPEPTSMLLLGTALVGAAGVLRKRF